MLKEFEELAVLEQGDDGAIVSIRGQGGPSVLLGAAYLGHLERVARAAAVELQRAGVPGTASAMHLLCAEVRTLLATYNETCNKFEGREPAAKSLAEAMEELDALRRALLTI